MQILFYWVTWFFWLIFYVVAIWICIIGKRKNPSRGWNLIIVAEMIYVLIHFLSMYYKFHATKLPIILLLNISKYFEYLSWGLILPVGMVLFLIGLYSIAKREQAGSGLDIGQGETAGA